MFVGCALLLIAAGFVSEVPAPIAARLASTNEVRGTFVQTKTGPDGRSFVTRGRFRVRPRVDFVWKTEDPFETCFVATPTNYVYSNEDETVSHRLEDLPDASRFAALGKGDPSVFFQVFDALYKEEGGRFFVKAKPKLAKLARALTRVEAEGEPDRWSLTATFPDRTTFRIDFDTRRADDVSNPALGRDTLLAPLPHGRDP